MREGWRWFGPGSDVTLDEVRQAGATDIVSALHEVPIGTVWTDAAVAERKNFIETTPAGRVPLSWSVVESIPIPDVIKRRGKEARPEIEGWIASLEAVARAGIRIVCYNFMPVVDWCRTDLDYRTPTGSSAMRFDQQKIAVFDLCIIERPGAEADYTPTEIATARLQFDRMPADEIAALTRNITSGLPGATTEPLTVPAFRERLAQYRGIDADRLRQHFVGFLEAVVPAAEKLGVTLTLHPDDPPRPLFGLPRISSTAEDFAFIFDAVPSPANGLCFCTGSFGVRADNDLVAIARRFAPRIAFAHLRATRREADPRTFHEAAHLEGDVDMVRVLQALLAEDARRDRGRSIVFRPDHGQRMIGDFARQGAPGYPVTGRLRGLAELRGIITALTAAAPAR
ncbi:MAG TPA: mannonate dehydratase [Devosia sp.]|nr:mannonate dehydratase [Devosia sp.]